MSFFVDANVVIYAAVPSDYQAPCLEILEYVARGEAEGRTSTAALEEVWHIELSGRAGELDGLTERAYRVLSPLLAVTDEALRRALALRAPALGANDRVHVGTCLAHGIDAIVSADAGFAEVEGMAWVDPRDQAARQRLLG